MENKKILCCIFNYGHSYNALKWLYRCRDRWKTYIMDTYVKSHPDSTDILKYYNGDDVILYDNIFCGGLTIESFKKSIDIGASFLLIINSDVEIDDENFENLCNRLDSLPEKIGVYEVSATENSSVIGMVGPQYKTLQYFFDNGEDFKTGGYGEGWLYGINVDIIKDILPHLSLSENKYGWGIGRALMEISKRKKLKNVIDNKVFAYHPKGTGYNGNEAFYEWINFDRKSEEIGIPFHFITVGYCSRKHNAKFRSYISEIFTDTVQIIEKICNEETKLTICQAYNEIIQEANYDTILLIHDDIEFINLNGYMYPLKDIFPELFLKYKDYGIIGLAPRSILDKDIIQRNYEPEYFFEEVDYEKDLKMSYNNGNLLPYFVDVSEDALVDGMFLAIRKDRIKSKFDESNKTFHYYDLDFCMSNYVNGVKIGITKAILVRHKMNNEEDFNELKNLKCTFVEKWKNYLPIIR